MKKQVSMWWLFCLKILGEYLKKVGWSLVEFMLVAEKNRFFFPPDTFQLMVNWWFGASCGLDIWDFLLKGRLLLRGTPKKKINLYCQTGAGMQTYPKMFSFAKRTLMDVTVFLGGKFLWDREISRNASGSYWEHASCFFERGVEFHTFFPYTLRGAFWGNILYIYVYIYTYIYMCPNRISSGYPLYRFPYMCIINTL